MAFNGSGTFARPVADYVFDTVVSETDMNTEMAGIATGLSTAILKDGTQTLTANIPFSGRKITGYGTTSAANARSDVPSVGQVQDSAFIWCSTATGTKNALTLTPTPAITAYATGQEFVFKAGATQSDDAVTIAISGLATKAGQFNDAACSATIYIEANKYYKAIYDGAALQLTRLSAFMSTFVQTLLDDASAAAARTTLGLGTMAVENVAAVPAMTYAAEQSYADNLLTRPKIKDYGETLVAKGSLGATPAFDYSAGNVQSGTNSEAITSSTMTNWPASGTAGSMTLFLTNGGAFSIVWPTSVDWPGGTAPTLTAAGVDILVFESLDGGTIVHGQLAAEDSK